MIARKDPAGRVWHVAYFCDVAPGETFQSNGNTWRKQSSRTAVMTLPERYAGAWFYFSQRETVERILTPA